MNLKQFEKQQYMTIETFRKNGQGVKTPVWFAEDAGALLIWTEINSGKAKRIRREGKVRVTPSSASGEPVGEWAEAQARADNSGEAVSRTVNLFKKKYGLMFGMFRMMGSLRKAKYTTIKVGAKL